ncbi:DUF3967 domain-containing protein [Bacillus cereus group sp. BfR-BA-01380]|uniref:DUF3967 domain-containing protein n=1 Tax=Bacillus cereus group sp. BfR-BA-01380 TaxID=2920324 RepID=UPI001F5ACBB3|nr:DUF3967 domain-containing protein [Bacillus cereus group sp. BfR-BA-01380]
MEKWFTLREISRNTSIPIQTVKRYVEDYQSYLNMHEEEEGVYIFHETCIPTLQEVRKCYKKGKNKEEIEEILNKVCSNSTAMVVKKSTCNEGPLLLEIHKHFEKENNVHQNLINVIQEQNKEIIKLHQKLNEHLVQKERIAIEERDRTLTQLLREIQNVKRELAKSKKKPWWKKVFLSEKN